MAGIGGCVTVSDDARRAADSPQLLVADPGAGGTGLILFPRPEALRAAWVGPFSPGLNPDDAALLLTAVGPCALLPEHGGGWFGRPGKAGHRPGAHQAGASQPQDRRQPVCARLPRFPQLTPDISGHRKRYPMGQRRDRRRLRAGLRQPDPDG